MKFFLKKVNKLNKGFTLVETLIAISIFTISILGLMSVLAQGVSSTSYAKQKMVASYLAQEGIEYIRNMRDTFVLYDPTKNTQVGWNAFHTYLTKLPSSCQNANGCYFDDQNLGNYTNQIQPMASITVALCEDSTCSAHPLWYDTSTGKYGYLQSSTSSGSGFTRSIKLTDVGTNEIKITSNVFWTEGSGSYSISFSEYLLSWQ